MLTTTVTPMENSSFCPTLLEATMVNEHVNIWINKNLTELG